MSSVSTFLDGRGSQTPCPRRSVMLRASSSSFASMCQQCRETAAQLVVVRVTSQQVHIKMLVD
jgi:hypothetical protein